MNPVYTLHGHTVYMCTSLDCLGPAILGKNMNENFNVRKFGEREN